MYVRWIRDTPSSQKKFWFDFKRNKYITLLPVKDLYHFNFYYFTLIIFHITPVNARSSIDEDTIRYKLT